MTRGRLFFGLLTITLLAVVLFTVRNQKTATFTDNATAVTIAVSTTPLSAPFYVARELGYFNQAGLDVKFLEVAGGSACFQMMMSGEADMATSSNSVIMFNGFNEVPFSVLASFVSSDNDIKIMARTSSGIDSPKDLAEKKIAVVKGSASDYFLYSYLAVNGVNVDSVSVVSMPPDHMPLALHRGEVDAISAWEPYAYESLNKKSSAVHLLPSKGIYSLTFNLVARPDSLTKDAQHRVITALHNAVTYIAHNPHKAKEIVLRHLALNPKQLNWAWQDYSFKLSMNRAFLVSLESQSRWAISNGMVDKDRLPDFTSYIDTRVLSQVDTSVIGM